MQDRRWYKRGGILGFERERSWGGLWKGIQAWGMVWREERVRRGIGEGRGRGGLGRVEGEEAVGKTNKRQLPQIVEIRRDYAYIIFPPKLHPRSNN